MNRSLSIRMVAATVALSACISLDGVGVAPDGSGLGSSGDGGPISTSSSSSSSSSGGVRPAPGDGGPAPDGGCPPGTFFCSGFEDRRIPGAWERVVLEPPGAVRIYEDTVRGPGLELDYPSGAAEACLSHDFGLVLKRATLDFDFRVTRRGAGPIDLVMLANEEHTGAVGIEIQANGAVLFDIELGDAHTRTATSAVLGAEWKHARLEMTGGPQPQDRSATIFLDGTSIGKVPIGVRFDTEIAHIDLGECEARTEASPWTFQFDNVALKFE